MSEPGSAQGQVLWSPPADVLDRTRIGDYLRWLDRERSLRFADYASLWRWSVDDLPAFWASVWDYFQVRGRRGDTVLEGDAMPGARWFPGARVNYAEQMLAGLPAEGPVVVARSQTREPVELTAAQLRAEVARARAGLVRLGVGHGDRVAAYLPNIPETLVLLLATASLGAVFSSCAPEFGTRSVVDRWSQIEPKVLVAVDGYRYGAKDIDRTGELAAIRAALPTLAHVVVVPYLSEDAARRTPGASTWADLLAGPDPGEPEFEPVAFDHPLYLLYSSGTTGLPKPIVHGHGGILLEHLKTLALHFDLGPGDRFFWFSTTGWMMWNVLVSGLLVGATVVLVDGNPAQPDLGHLWRLADECGVTFFGTSAPFLMSCRRAGLRPADVADLSRIRGLGSTGAPLPPEGFGWVYENVNPTLQLQSFSGGTDLCTGFVGGSPLLPVYAGELSCACLGAAVAAYDPAGHPVVGQLGELVIERPMPSMPVGFWGDSDGSRYRAAYFADFPGVWRHGDWVEITPRGTCVITGRSDATLKRGGVRMGTAEFYSVVDGFPEITDSLVVHLENARPGGASGAAADADASEELLLFVVLAEGTELDDDLRRRLAAGLRRELSPRHVPDEIVAVRAIPRTLSGKKLEVPVKRILEGRPVEEAASTGALSDPGALAAFEAYARNRRQAPE
ncbi:acetoacetyl-CoA synthetase [Actinopolymorpha cephalotaxi]|uniref:Acetoacetyl-CoA synthetase n=1 Tax=Actinopolymorpha cephalotaxi TaxID=504797 RepID=A0A1I2KMH0_9ACTN|nr:acetoacetate--CoA ligase [Actinopolymorpha cephalotaxi]NYH84544.1 acetoacetyl-CoA synthetase [Actinopolymorpha cephalotaxi]SFF68174.1 acetoacetyl-CoA synthetase [Actinopolymorpha cephalotaxi]